MSQPRTKTHDYDHTQDHELAMWPGVGWSRQLRGKHYALILTYAGISRFVTYPCTPSDGHRGALNHIRDVRHMLVEMGATRRKPTHSTSPKRTRNRTEPTRIDLGEPATGGPCRDPWAKLAELHIEPTPPAEPPPLIVSPAPSPIRKTMVERVALWIAGRIAG